MTAALTQASVVFRSVQPEDEPFLSRLYASTRQHELASLDWSEAQKTAFLAQQFQFQHHYYQTHFAGADFHIIQCDGVDIGRRYTAWRAEGLVLIDLALLPEWRGRGIGTTLILNLQQLAAQRGMPLSMHVEADNPAARLYDRLGFIEIANNGVHRKLRWTPPRIERAAECVTVQAVA